MTYSELETRIELLRKSVQDMQLSLKPHYDKLNKQFDDTFDRANNEIKRICSEIGIKEPLIQFDPYCGMKIHLHYNKTFPEPKSENS